MSIEKGYRIASIMCDHIKSRYLITYSERDSIPVFDLSTREFQASQGYTVRHCFKKQTNKNLKNKKIA